MLLRRRLPAPLACASAPASSSSEKKHSLDLGVVAFTYENSAVKARKKDLDLVVSIGESAGEMVDACFHNVTITSVTRKLVKWGELGPRFDLGDADEQLKIGETYPLMFVTMIRSSMWGRDDISLGFYIDEFDMPWSAVISRRLSGLDASTPYIRLRCAPGKMRNLNQVLREEDLKLISK